MRNEGRLKGCLEMETVFFVPYLSSLRVINEHHFMLRKIIANSEAKVELFKKFHLAVNQTDYVEHQKNMSQSCTWGTNLEIIVTATIFKMDVYVVSDTYRPGKATWLKYSPDRAAMLEIEKYSSILNLIKKFPMITTRRWLEIAHICRCHFDSVKTNTVNSIKSASTRWHD